MGFEDRLEMKQDVEIRVSSCGHQIGMEIGRCEMTMPVRTVPETVGRRWGV